MRFFLLSAPSEADARQAQDQIYVLEEKRDRMAKEAKDREAAKQLEETERLQGDWFRDWESHGSRGHFTLTLKLDARGVWRMDSQEYSKEDVSDLRVVGSEVRFKRDRKSPEDRRYVCATYEVRGSISLNGNKLILVEKRLPLAPDWSEYYCKHWIDLTTTQYVGEYTRQ